MLLTTGDIGAMQAALLAVANLTVKLQQKGSGNTWADVSGQANIPFWISPSKSYERLHGQDLYGYPIDGTGFAVYSAQFEAGRKVVVQTVNGTTATGAQAKEYIILNVNDGGSLGAIVEVKLWQATSQLQ